MFILYSYAFRNTLVVLGIAILNALFPVGLWSTATRNWRECSGRDKYGRASLTQQQQQQQPAAEEEEEEDEEEGGGGGKDTDSFRHTTSCM